MVSPQLDPFPPVELGGVRFLIDRNRPVAFLRNADEERFVTWPDAPLPLHPATGRLVTAPDAVWVVYEADSNEPGERVWSTAVRIDPDGSASAVEIGQLTVIGADSSGIWASGRPWPWPERLSRELISPIDGDEGAWDFDSPDLPLESWEEFQKDQARWQREQERELLKPRTVNARERVEGDDADSHGWFAFAPNESPDQQRVPLEPPPAPGPSSAVELVRFGVDGHIDTITVDRTVARIEQVGGRTLMTFFPTNPVGRVEPSGSLGYSYPRNQIVVDFSAGVPSTLAVEDFAATALLSEEWDPIRVDDAPEQTVASDRVDLTGVGGITWAPAQLSNADIQIAVDRVVEQLERLTEPTKTWTRRDDQVHLVESPYLDLKVGVSGDWPEIVVTVEFRNREHSRTLFRRRYRVFDANGRPVDSRYLTVYLEEDIATGSHPPERDGVIDLPDA
ncbi:hypothetical protein [Leifsonia sp. NPDC080035]|uniref:Uncharacterized protein n=1 Tax=Leifsonia sp. NPDC080035 TaxID=3143936 RepID=A0AAU7GF83_9MICO